MGNDNVQKAWQERILYAIPNISISLKLLKV